MRYIADSDGYLQEVSFGAEIICGNAACVEYTGSVPADYTSLEAWYIAECEKLYRWKIVSGELTLDSSAVAPVAGGLYPIGSIYLSVTETTPAELFGGTWERIKDTFLLAAGDTYAAGATGGEATHKLTVDEMPSHSHYINYCMLRYASGVTGSVANGDGKTWSQINGPYTNNTGGGAAHNNMPPYLAVYMWRRTA